MSSLRSWDAWLNSIWSIWLNFSCCLSFIIKWHLHTELAQVCIWILCFEVIPGSSFCFIRNFICFIWSWPCKPHRVRIQRVKDFYCFYNQNGCFFWFLRIIQENCSRESFEMIICTPSSELTTETLWTLCTCERFKLPWNQPWFQGKNCWFQGWLEIKVTFHKLP